MGEYHLCGEVNLNFLFESGNILNTKSVVLQFTFDMESNLIDDSSSMEIELTVNKDNFTIIGDGTVEVDIGIEFNLGFSRDRNLNLIQDISMEDMKPGNSYSMVIYFVKPGDTLWRIAKNLRSTVEDIERVNDLDGSSRIFPGQQLFIPKYIKRNIA